MTENRTSPEINERLVQTTRSALQNALEVARRADPALTTITLPAAAIDGLLGMLQDPTDDEYWYRRRQFIVFYAKFMLSESQGLGE